MFAEPTQNDFLDCIRWHLNQAAERAKSAVQRVESEHTAKGRYQSGSTIIRVIEEARKEFDAGISAALSELSRTIRISKLDRSMLRQLAVQSLQQFSIVMKEVVQPDKLKSFGSGSGTLHKTVDERLAAFDQHLQFMVRQYDVGFFSPAEPEAPPMTNNSINIATMTGSTIQQGSPGATQAVEFRLSIETVSSALNTLESELKTISMDDRVKAELTADIATIKAQLSRPLPSTTIMQEAGRSVRKVVEGIAVGVLTPKFIAAVTALGAALGIG